MSFLLTSFFDSFIGFANKAYTKFDSFASKRKTLLWGGVVSFVFFVILFLNILTPLIADDIGYLYIFGEAEEVSSLSDLIYSQKVHYMRWGGRSVVHFIAQALLQAPSLVADILNAAMYLAFIFLIYFHIKGKTSKHSLSLFVLLNLMVWFVIPMFGDTVLWLTGSANYLWGTSIILLFLLPYRFYKGERKVMNKSIFYSMLMFIFGIIAGWTNENTVAGLIIIILLFFLYYRSLKWSVSPPLLVGFLGLLIGYAIMILAPGNFVRAGESNLSLFLITYRLFTYTQSLFLNYGFLLILYFTLLIIVEKNNKTKRCVHLSLIYLLGALAAIYAMVLSPQFPARAWFGVITFLIISIGMVFSRLNFEDVAWRKVRFAIIAVCLAVFLFSFYEATKDVYRIYEIDKERKVLAAVAVEAGDKVCYFKQFIAHTRYVHSEDASSNGLFTYYYGIVVEYKD